MLAAIDPELRTRVPARLGLHEGQTVVLYPPMWRDNAKTITGRYAMVNHLELDVVAAFGTSAVLLVRGHGNLPGLGTVDTAGVLDLSAYPAINDLTPAAADVLITSYSMVMFDFVTAGRATIFLTSDLGENAEVTRGSYLDIALRDDGQSAARVVDEIWGPTVRLYGCYAWLR